MEWHWWFLGWWLGMAPASWMAGQMARTSKTPPSDSATIIFVVTWPVQLFAAPAVLAYLAAKNRKPKAQGDKGGKPG